MTSARPGLIELDEISVLETRAFPVMGKEAFIGIPGQIVDMLRPHTESDPVAVLFNTMAFFGNAVGRGPRYQVEGTDHGPNIFVLQVGDSAKSRKGTGADRVKQIFRLADEEWTTHRMHSGLSSGEGVIWAVRDAITKMVREGKGADAHMTEQEVDSGIKDKRLMVLETEMAGALRAMQREGNILSRVLRDGWDRGDVEVLTKTSQARATGSCISIVGHITASELRDCLDKTEMANGFANRFLFACVRRSKFLPFGGNLPDNELATMAEDVAKAITRAKHIGRVTMNAEAAAGWMGIYEDLSADRPGLLGALTARAEAQAVRLAMLYAICDGKPQIEMPHLMAAVAVADFCKSSVEYVFGDSLGDVVADTILSALKTATAGLTRTEISAIFNRNVPANQIARALDELLRRGLADHHKTPSPSGAGRQIETWFLVRKG